MEQPARTYTVDEANAALPEVRRLVAIVVDRVNKLPELQEDAQVAEYRANRDAAQPADEDRRVAARRALHDAELELAAAAAKLEKMAISLKDPRVGLIDFYGYRDGELVELCWRLGEPAVANWHRIGDGYAGRQPL